MRDVTYNQFIIGAVLAGVLQIWSIYIASNDVRFLCALIYSATYQVPPSSEAHSKFNHNFSLKVVIEYIYYETAYETLY
jgi:hypothetical protein